MRLPDSASAARLDAGGTLSRSPRHPDRERPEPFWAAFDRYSLFYDCFWHHDGERVLLVGPAPQNLFPAVRRARFRAGATTLSPRFHRSLSVMITELRGVPAGTAAVTVDIEGQSFELPVQPNLSRELEGRRLLFTINRDNDLTWIREWALFHARRHGTDAVVLVDNGSTRYDTDELAAALLEVPGIEHVAVPSWPQSFGPIDPAVKVNPYWSRFLQISSMSMVLRRYGALAYGLLNMDIDELAGTHSGRSMYDLAHEAKAGLVVFRGRWVEATAREGETRHRDFLQRAADPALSLSAQRKWALDPRRPWVAKLRVHPYWHWIEGRPLLGKSMPDDAFYWHFKGINTNWKTLRAAAPALDLRLEMDDELQAALRSLEDQ